MQHLNQGDLVVFEGKWSKTHSTRLKNYYGSIGVIFNKTPSTYQYPWSVVKVWFIGNSDELFFICDCYIGDLKIFED